MQNRYFYSFRMAANAKRILYLLPKVKNCNTPQNIINSAMILQKILQIGVISYNMTLFEIICVLHQFHHWTLPIMEIDRVQFQLLEYVSTESEPRVWNKQIM